MVPTMLICPHCERLLGVEHDAAACRRGLSRRFFFGLCVAPFVARMAPAQGQGGAGKEPLPFIIVRFLDYAGHHIGSQEWVWPTGTRASAPVMVSAAGRTSLAFELESNFVAAPPLDRYLNRAAIL
jgi:hypothetical protein